MQAIGFYWTLPAPWAGFTQLPRGADAAALASRSIRYQVQRVRRWVKDQGGSMLVEEAHMEARDDRGTSALLGPARKLLARAEAAGAVLVAVDFSERYHWRPHGPLWGLLRDHPSVAALDLSPEMIDGQIFDPVDHFRAWSEAKNRHQATKPDAKALVLDRVSQLRAEGLAWSDIAERLNAEGLTTPQGRSWKPDNLRKLASPGQAGPSRPQTNPLSA